MKTKIHILRVFESHVEKPMSFEIFSKEKVSNSLTQYGFYVNQLPYEIVLDSTNFDSEESILFMGGKVVPYTMFYSTKKNKINYIYLKKVRFTP